MRDFHGFKVSEDFVIGVKYKGNNLSINMQEVMAYRLKGHPFTTSDKFYTGQTCADILGVGYGQMKSVRSDEKWQEAREEFKSANSLDDEQVAKLSGFSSQGAANGNSKVKGGVLTKGDAQALGLRIAAALNPEETGFLLAENKGIRGSYFTRGIEAFVVCAKRNLFAHKKNEAARIAEGQRLEKEARFEELKGEAIDTLNALGVSEPTDEQIEIMVAKLDV